MISAKNSFFFIFDRNIFIKFQLKCLGAQRASRNFYLGDHLLGLGTQAQTPGSPKGSLKFSLEQSLGRLTILGKIAVLKSLVASQLVFYYILTSAN